MSNPITFTGNAKEVKAQMKAQMPLIYKQSRLVFRSIGKAWEEEVVKSFTGYGGWKNRTPGGAGGRLQNRSGKLRRSLRYRITGRKLDGLTLTVGAGYGTQGAGVYAGTQEKGATITPKRRRALTIPLTRALTPSGQLSSRAVLRPDGRGYETGFGRTFIRHGVIFAKKSGHGNSKPVALYKLVRSVQIPPRLNAGRRFRKRVDAMLPLWRRQIANILAGKPKYGS